MPDANDNTTGEKHTAEKRSKQRKRRKHTLIGTLRRKFIVSAMIAVTLVLVGIVAALNIGYYLRLCNRADAQTDVVAASGGSFDQVVENVKGSMPPKDESSTAVSTTPPEETPNEDKQAVTLASQFDDSFGFSEETPYEMRYFTVTVDESGQVTDTNVSQIVTVGESDAQQMALQVIASGNERGFFGETRYLVTTLDDGSTFVVFLDCSRDFSSLRALITASLAVLACALVLVFILVWFFSKKTVAPIAESYARQRRFITDASHDLKTPLAVIGSSADVLEIENGPSEWIDSIRHQVSHMTDLTNKLVMLARMDEGGDTLAIVETDVAQLVNEVANEFEPVARTGGRSIVCDVPDTLTASVDPTMVRQALSLLVDNALKYSNEGATVTLSCSSRRHDHVRIVVENPCAPTDQGDHSELFERFYRSDEARESSGGHGIGLAVVRAIAEAHGGTATAVSPDGTSMRFTLDL